jgi:hypothetical protein
MAPPSEWGPPAWFFIFSVIGDMPEYPKDTDYYQMFFESFRGVLPCPECRKHYNAYIDVYPPPVWSREATRQWAQTLRNKIRERNQNKPKNWLWN